MEFLKEWERYYQTNFPNDEIPEYKIIILNNCQALHDKRIELISIKAGKEKLRQEDPTKSAGTFLVAKGGAYYILLVHKEGEELIYNYWHEFTHMIYYHSFQKQTNLTYEQICCCSDFTSKDELLAYLRSDLLLFKYTLKDSNFDKKQVLEFAKQQLERLITEYPLESSKYALYNIQRICGYVLAVQQFLGVLLYDNIPSIAQEFLAELSNQI